MECSNCGFTNPSGNKFCGMCGTRLARACSACGFLNPPDFRFCGQCGTPLVQEADRAQLVPPPVRGELDEIEAPAPEQPPMPPAELPTHLEGSEE